MNKWSTVDEEEAGIYRYKKPRREKSGLTQYI